MKNWLALLGILLPSFVWAASGGHGGGHGLDEHAIKTIIFQAINVGILVVALVYFTKNTVRQMFKDKQQAYLSAADKAQAVRKQAEAEHAEIKARLTKLEGTADESISRARADAADMRNQMIAEAQTMSKRVREEAEQTAKIEIERAKVILREQMISEAAKLAQQDIKTRVSGEDHQRLQGDFVQNIQAVQP